MRPLVPSCALSAIVLCIALLASACTADTTIGADTPEATDQDRGVAVDPLPTATPTAAAVERAEPTAASEPAGPAFEFDRSGSLDLNGDGVVSLEEESTMNDHPRASAAPVVWPIADVAEYAYERRPAEIIASAAGGVQDLQAIETNTTSPDGAHIWVPIGTPNNASPASEATCGDGPGHRLGIATITGGPGRVLAQPADELPPNVSAVHVGPTGRALLYTSCDGVTRPAMFATVTPDGNFTDLQPVDPLMQATTSAMPPTWNWGEALPTEEWYSIGSLIVSIPQVGVVQLGDEPDTPSHVYLEADTGRVFEVWPSPLLWRTQYGYEYIESDGVSVNNGSIPLPDASVHTIVARDAAGPGAPPQALIGTATGGVIATTALNDYDIEVLPDRPFNAAAWAPVGPWLALTGDDGTWLHSNGQSYEVSPFPGEQVYFTPDGSRLVVTAAQQHQVIVFEPFHLSDDASAVSAYSPFNSGGLGPIRIEDRVSDLRQRLNIDLRVDGIDGIEPGYCVWIWSPDLPGISMLGEAVTETDAVVTSIVVLSGPWKTPSGLRVGSTEDQVRAAFPGRLDEQPHTYIGGNYLTFVPSDANDNYSIKFETNGHQVIRMHAGRKGWISLVEGCA